MNMQDSLFDTARCFFNNIQNACYQLQGIEYNAYSQGYCQWQNGVIRLCQVDEKNYPLPALPLYLDIDQAARCPGGLPYMGMVRLKSPAPDQPAVQYLAVTNSAGFVSCLLRQTSANAYSELCQTIQTDKNTLRTHPWPTPAEFVYSAQLLGKSQHWQVVGRNQHLAVEQLQPGDILAWVTGNNGRSTGHVMIVVNPPQANGNDSYEVEVYDCSEVIHDRDTRLPHQPGVGKGFVTLATTNLFPFWRFRFRQSLHLELPKNIVALRLRH